MIPLNRWRVYCKDDFSRSFTDGVSALKFVYEVVEIRDRGVLYDDRYRFEPLWKYNLRLVQTTKNGHSFELTVWEEGEDHENIS
jgi:hypothetical protein